MNFDYTYITLFGFIVFEPVVILTNVLFSILCISYYNNLCRYESSYAIQMRTFILLTGISAIFGAMAHGVHYQLGSVFFSIVFFIMNTLNILSIYYCFRAPFTYYNRGSETSQKYLYLVFVWIGALIIYSILNGNFLVIKIHAGIALLYSLVIHFLAYKKNNESGSRTVVIGIGISFGAIIAHSLKISIHEWFNYKDISHLIMIASLMVIYKGIKQNAESLELGDLESEAVKIKA